MLDDASVVGAMDVTDRFLSTFNACDARGHAATLAYPHVRLASGTVRIWEDIDQATADVARAFTALRGQVRWHHSRWDHRNLIHVSTTKVHLDVQFTRYREDDSVIGIYPAVYVVVLADDQWLIQCRSSFAP